MNYSTDDAVRLHHDIVKNLEQFGPDVVHGLLCAVDAELLALTLTLHTLKTLPHHTA